MATDTDYGQPAIDDLSDALRTALSGVRDASRNFEWLTSSEIWHVEYVEGYGKDIAAFLEDARRALVAATALHEKAAAQ